MSSRPTQKFSSWALTAIAFALSGCPCEEEERKVALVAPEQDPRLGRFEGTLTWLQTGEETAIHVEATPQTSSIEYSSCGGSPRAPVLYTITTEDELLTLEEIHDPHVRNNGYLERQDLYFSLSAGDLHAAGMLPESPGLTGRNPTASLRLSQEDDGSGELLLRVTSSSDSLTIAAGTLDPSSRR